MPTDRGEYRPIFTRLLNGPDFKELGADARSCFYPIKLRLPAAGIGVIPGLIAVLVDDTALSTRRVKAAVAELEAKDWLRKQGTVIWLVRGLEFEPTLNPINKLHREHIRNVVKALPTRQLVEDFKAHYAEWFREPDEAGGQATVEAQEGPSKGPRSTTPTPTPTPTTSPNQTPGTKSKSNSTVARRKKPGAPTGSVIVGTHESGFSKQGVTHNRKAVHPRSVAAIVEHLAEVQQEGRAEYTREQMRHLGAELIFAYWAAKTSHEGVRLDPKRERYLIARLKEGDDNVHEALYVVDGCLRDKNLQGQNERGRKYDEVSTIFRDREQVERLSALGGYKPGKEHPMAKKYATAATTAPPPPAAT